VSAALDGSYFQRLMLAGGRFDALPDVTGASSGPGLPVLAICSVFLLAILVRERRRGPLEPRAAARAFVVLGLVLTLVGLLLTPRAIRIHHYLNAWPFPQLVIATALVELWRRAGDSPRRVALRLAVAGLAIGVLAGSARVTQATHETIRETGGQGRWSDAARAYVATLPPTARIVCLDWGFAGPLRFADPARSVAEPIWTLRRARDPRAAASLAGTPADVYLVYEQAFAVYPYGLALLEAVGSLPADSVSVSRHSDRHGEPVFVAIRFQRPHRVAFQGGRARVELR
jgi:hypothetical protein